MFPYDERNKAKYCYCSCLQLEEVRALRLRCKKYVYSSVANVTVAWRVSRASLVALPRIIVTITHITTLALHSLSGTLGLLAPDGAPN